MLVSASLNHRYIPEGIIKKQIINHECLLHDLKVLNNTFDTLNSCQVIEQCSKIIENIDNSNFNDIKNIITIDDVILYEKEQITAKSVNRESKIRDLREKYDIFNLYKDIYINQIKVQKRLIIAEYEREIDLKSSEYHFIIEKIESFIYQCISKFHDLINRDIINQESKYIDIMTKLAIESENMDISEYKNILNNKHEQLLFQDNEILEIRGSYFNEKYCLDIDEQALVILKEIKYEREKITMEKIIDYCLSDLIDGLGTEKSNNEITGELFHKQEVIHESQKQTINENFGADSYEFRQFNQLSPPEEELEFHRKSSVYEDNRKKIIPVSIDCKNNIDIKISKRQSLDQVNGYNQNVYSMSIKFLNKQVSIQSKNNKFLAEKAPIKLNYYTLKNKSIEEGDFNGQIMTQYYYYDQLFNKEDINQDGNYYLMIRLKNIQKILEQNIDQLDNYNKNFHKLCITGIYLYDLKIQAKVKHNIMVINYYNRENQQKNIEKIEDVRIICPNYERLNNIQNFHKEHIVHLNYNIFPIKGIYF